jgi:hypothetical protein
LPHCRGKLGLKHLELATACDAFQESRGQPRVVVRPGQLCTAFLGVSIFVSSCRLGRNHMSRDPTQQAASGGQTSPGGQAAILRRSPGTWATLTAIRHHVSIGHWRATGQNGKVARRRLRLAELPKSASDKEVLDVDGKSANPLVGRVIDGVRHGRVCAHISEFAQPFDTSRIVPLGPLLADRLTLDGRIKPGSNINAQPADNPAEERASRCRQD